MVNETGALTIHEWSKAVSIITVFGLEPNIEIARNKNRLWLWDVGNVVLELSPKRLTNRLEVQT